MRLSKNIVLSVIAVLLALLSFYILNKYYPKLHPLSQTEFKITQQEAEQRALNFLEKPIPEAEREDRIEFIIDKDIMKSELQPVLDILHQNNIHPLQYWEFSYISEKDKKLDLIIGADEPESTRDLTGNWYIIRLSSEGKLLKLDFENPRLAKLKDTLKTNDEITEHQDISEREAQKQAISILAELDTDTSGLVLQNKEIQEDSLKKTFEFTYTETIQNQPVYHTIKLAQKTFLSYQFDFEKPSEKEEPTFSNSSKLIFGIYTVVIFIALIILILIYLVYFLRRESVSFKISLPIVYFILAISFIRSVLIVWDSTTWMVLLSGVLGALFSGLGMLFLYTVNDALVRQQWADKLFVFDRFLQGRFFSFKSGQAILAGIFLGLISLTWYILVLYSYKHFFDGAFYLRENLNYSLILIFPVLSFVLGYISESFFHEFFFRMFGLSVIKKWLKKNKWVLLLGIIPGLLFSIEVSVTNIWIRLIAHIVPALLFTYFFIRFEIFTTIIGYFTILSVSHAVIFINTGESYFKNLGNGLFLILGLLLIIGIVTMWIRRNEDEEQTRFIPEYLRKLEEKERLMRELEIAHSIQQKFLPKGDPKIANYQISAICQPAYEVGGDYYDYFQMGGDQLGIVIGDVSNKGISAAFFMTLVKGFFKALTREIKKPSEVVCEVNRLFYQDVERGHFISMIFGILNIKSGEFVFSRAGHNPLLYITGKSASNQWVTPPGVGIGLLPDEKFRNHIREEKIILQPGDTVVLFTDGYTEAMNEQQQEFGEERFQSVIDRNKSVASHQLIEKLEEAISDWYGSQPPMDDRTIVVIKRQNSA